MRDPQPVRPRGPLDATVRVPGSRSETNRALLVAALADGRSAISGLNRSDDAAAMRDCLGRLGIEIEESAEGVTVQGRGGSLDASPEGLDVRASGTTARFVTAAATLADGPNLIDGAPRMRERPIRNLVEALGDLGAPVEILGTGGCPPVRVLGGGLPGGEARVDARRSSSQFVSALVMAAPHARRDVTLRLEEGVLISRPYVELTLAVARAFGAEAGFEDRGTLHIAAATGYRSRPYAVEPDASSAVYALAAAAVSGGRVRVEGLGSGSLQADARFVDVLERMGCEVERHVDYLEVRRDDPDRPLRALDEDLNDMPDAALTAAVLALFADGPSELRNLPNLRIKETDRLEALQTEIRRLGGRAEARADSIRIEPAPLRGAEVQTYDDHRIAMAFALVGLRVPGVTIRDPDCVAKTWPDYFSALERL